MLFRSEYYDAVRGYYADLEGRRNTLTFDELIKTMPTVKEIKEECPETLNPSRWMSNHIDILEGVYEVIPKRVYQVRGYKLDLATLTAVRGKTGWIIIDTMTTVPACKKAVDLIKQTVEDIPVSAIIITHSHFDHFGGYAAIGRDDIPLYIPENFEEMYLDETMLAGPAMRRRSEFMYGTQLNNSMTSVTGKANTAPRRDEMTFPHSSMTTEISKNQTLVVDGVTIDFINTPQVEAPADMMLYFPEFKMLDAADNMLHVMHNLGTLRGAKVRSGKVWSQCIDDVIVKYGKEVQIHIGQHGWPVFGNEKIVHFWTIKRDLYKFMHDQALHYANMGYTPNELAEVIKLPPSLNKEHCCRGLYGTLNHNLKSQFQLYLGWYDGNPAHLNELPPVELSKRYVKAMGGEDAAVRLGKEAYDSGDYRWAATVLNHVIFTNKHNTAARELLADVYDQLSYTQECTSWQYNYATAAYELRLDEKKPPVPTPFDYKKIPLHATIDFCTVSVSPELLEGISSTIHFQTNDTNESVYLVISNGTLHMRHQKCDIDSELVATKALLIDLLVKDIMLDECQEKGQNISVLNHDVISKFLDAIDILPKAFTFVEPNDI